VEAASSRSVAEDVSDRISRRWQVQLASVQPEQSEGGASFGLRIEVLTDLCAHAFKAGHTQLGRASSGLCLIECVTHGEVFIGPARLMAIRARCERKDSN
jgi:hypothetical protein